MKSFLLPENGQFYKANLHCHTNLSDACKSPAQVKEIYQRMGYSVVAYTDHDIFLTHDELTDDGFLALHGFEMEINERTEGISTPFERTCHLCFIDLDPANRVQPCWHRSRHLFMHAREHRQEVVFDENEPDFERVYGRECVNAAIRIAREKGFFVTYNHPTWSQERYPDYIGYTGMNAMEMFNGNALSCGFDECNGRVYDDFLRKGEKIFCIGADDNHNGYPETDARTDAGRAFTVIKAESLEYRSVTKALEKGHFYSSEGPSIYGLWMEDGAVHIRCSAADRIMYNSGIRAARLAINPDHSPLTEASFPVKREHGYFRLTVVDGGGSRACTNAYFTQDLDEI